MNDYYSVDPRSLIAIGITIGLMLSCVTGVVKDWIGRMQFGKGRQETNEKLDQMIKQLGHLADKSEELPHRDSLLKLSNQLKTLEKIVFEEVNDGTSKKATPENDSTKEYVNGAAK